MRRSEILTPPEEELPHLWQKPAYSVLLACLETLHVEPRVWGIGAARTSILQAQAATAHDRRETVAFLSAIIKSSLPWLDGDDEREVIWEAASKRMSERCGRTGMSGPRRWGEALTVAAQPWERSSDNGPSSPRTMAHSA